jgi:hypothetical protein
VAVHEFVRVRRKQFFKLQFGESAENVALLARAPSLPSSFMSGKSVFWSSKRRRTLFE